MPELLQTKSKLGRVAFIVDGRPMVLPVNYRAGRNSVVFCTRGGTKLDSLKNGAPAAFEVDVRRSLYHSDWNVLVQGKAEEVTDPKELDELRRGPLKSWASRDRSTDTVIDRPDSGPQDSGVLVAEKRAGQLQGGI